MNLGKRSAGAALLAAVLLAAATGCSNKAQDNSSSGSSGGGDVKTDVGVEGKTIKLGVLTDLTGVFAALGKDLTNSNTLYWKDHKVCDTYNVELDVQDTGYVPQTGVQLYSGMKDSVLGDAADHRLADQHRARARSTRPTRSSTSRRPGRRRSPRSRGTGVVGATYDVEITNGYDYLFKQGLLKEGDTVGHIYFEGEYGANGLAGSKAVAEEKGLNDHRGADQVHRPGHERPGHPVQGRRGQGDRPDRRAGPDGLGGRGGRGAGPGRADRSATTRSSRPACSQGPTAAWLKTHLYVASPVSTFDKLRRPAEGVPGRLPRRDAEPRCARGHRHGRP